MPEPVFDAGILLATEMKKAVKKKWCNFKGLTLQPICNFKLANVQVVLLNDPTYISLACTQKDIIFGMWVIQAVCLHDDWCQESREAKLDTKLDWWTRFAWTWTSMQFIFSSKMHFLINWLTDPIFSMIQELSALPNTHIPKCSPVMWNIMP